MKQGESVTLTRVPGWWADKKKFFRNRFNPDAIKVTVVRDPGRAFELFRKGDLDWHGLSLPEYWYEKLSNDHALVKNGHVQKIQFYNDIPRPTWAIRLNSSHPVLSNRDIRVGMNYAINFSAVIEKCFQISQGTLCQGGLYSSGAGWCSPDACRQTVVVCVHHTLQAAG